MGRGLRGLVEGVRVGLAVVLLSLAPSLAMAQPVDAGGEPGALQAEVEADYAQAMASDCALACKALGSMRRATQRLCELDPGDRCTGAKQKLGAATAHVHAACPECAEALGGEPMGGTSAAPAPPEMEAVAQESVASKRGGCAGCAISETGTGAAMPVGLALFAGWVARRRRRR
ncbi:MAG: MYXO-CTERM sorting domain-containing protein [Polyangiaceae bacterium]